MNPFWERFFYLLTYLSQGASFLNPTSYSVMHQRHHAFSDGPKDPHSPANSGSVWKMMLTTYKEYKKLLDATGEVHDEAVVYRAPRWERLDTFAKTWTNVWLWVLVYLSLYFALGVGPAWFLLLPLHFLVGPAQGAIVNWCGHKLGYRNYDLKDQSRNTLPIDIPLMGELYQNNHHKSANKIDFAHRWFEIDMTYQISWILNRLGIIQFKENAR